MPFPGRNLFPVRRRERDRVPSPQPPRESDSSRRDGPAELPASTTRLAPSHQSPLDLFRSNGDNYSSQGRYPEAIVMYTAALELAQNDTTILLSRGFAHTMTDPPRLDLTLQDAENAIQQQPTFWRGWSLAGEAHLRMEAFQAAEEAFQNAVGFATGMDKLTAQRSLAEVRQRRTQSSPIAELQTPFTSPMPTVSSLSSPLRSPTTSQSSRSPSVQQSLGTTSTVSSPPTLSPVARDSTSNASPTSPQSPQADPVRPAPQSNIGAQNSQSTTSQPSVQLHAANRPNPPSAATQPANPRPTGRPPAIDASQHRDTASATRSQGSASTFQTPSSNLPVSRDELVDLIENPTEAPPGYTPNISNPDPTIRTLSQGALDTQLRELQINLGSQRKGSLSILPQTLIGNIDAVQLAYIGMTTLQLTARELGTPTYLHPGFAKMAVDVINYPGSTFLDMDCETSAHYEGPAPGTVTVRGYSEEYRAQQVLRAPLLNLTLESSITPPVMTTARIVERLGQLQLSPTLEDNGTLKQILGISSFSSLGAGYLTLESRQTVIETICMALNGGLYNAPTRFIDFSKPRNFSSSTLGGLGITLQNFLFQILLGAELILRLRKEPILTNYAGLISNSISSLIVLADLWMQNVSIPAPVSIGVSNTRFKLIAVNHQKHTESLIRFGEAISWPYMDEARHYIEGAYQALIANPRSVGWDLCDWMFGLVLPGKCFRHRIMCCLVSSSPSVRSLQGAPYYDNGIVVANKSYWPRRTVLGRVLGALRNPNSVCGWIGPLPAPEGTPTGWIRLNARPVDIPVPISSMESSLEALGFEERPGTETAEAMISSIVDPNEWSTDCSPPARPASNTSRSRLRAIRLTQISPAATTTLLPSINSLPTTEHRASLDFDVNGTTMTYTLFSNPIFVCAPPCVGQHPMHRRQADKFLRNFVQASGLRTAYPAANQMLVIDATGEGEEAVARAWCSERGRNAVIRRGGDCCFACATKITSAIDGVGFNVLIWAR